MTLFPRAAGFGLLLLVASWLVACGGEPSERSAPAPVTAPASPPPTPASPGISFSDVTAATGIDMLITSGRMPSSQILEVKGGGLALIDFDADSDLDVFVPNGATMDDPEHGPGCRLFENLDGMKFRDATTRAKLSFQRWGTGVAVGDIDGDRFDDLYIACYGRDALLRNNGDGTFEEVTESAGLGDDRWSTSCAFGDIDNDGDLDLYVANYIDFDVKNPPPPTHFLGVPVFAGPMGLPAQHDALYENLGDGTFRDISETSGIRVVKASYGLGVVILDFDRDGRQDIFVGNDSMKNFLFRNLGRNRFEDIAARGGLATNGDGSEQATMGIAIGDVDGNGFADVFTTNFSNDTNTLHLNRDGVFYDDRTQQYGLGIVSRPFVGWATMFYDFDHDADEDLLVVNGHTYPHATMQSMSSEYRQVPLLFERRGARLRRVTDASAGAWLNEAHVDRSAVFGDLDNDGDIDAIISELNGPLRVLRNECIAPDRPTDRAWLIVELKDSRAGVHNHRGLGARVELHAGGSTQTRWVFSGGSFQAACAQSAHFGLGEISTANAPKLSLTIIWPDGSEQKVSEVMPNQRLTIERASN